MIIWGGMLALGRTSQFFDDGFQYDPSTDTWTPLPNDGAPSPRSSAQAVWTGREMIVWDGVPGGLCDGARYNPATQTWARMSSAGAPCPRSLHTGVWAAEQMIVWGGFANGTVLGDGGRYMPPFSAAPAAPHDARYFVETGFRVDHDPFWDYFSSHGGIDAFGVPVSRAFALLGCTTQVFQRHVLQQCADAPVQLMNVLDPDLLPYNVINGSTFPAHDPQVASGAPPPGTPN
jgi:hypothetical protein